MMGYKIYDTLLGVYIRNPGIRGLSLDKLAPKEFNHMMISYDYITKKGKINLRDVSIFDASHYSAENTYIAYELYKKQINDGITKDKVLNEIEIPLVLVLMNMELSGVKINRDKLKEIGILLSNEINRLEKEIYHDAGTEFNINSPRQVGDILFNTLKLPTGKKNKTGYSVSAEVLNELAFNYDIANKIVEYRHYSKLLSTFIEGLQKLLDENDFLHTSYNQAVTTTGRLSSTNPNLQNIPASAGIAGEIRGAFVSRFPKGKILTLDYSQVEMRILAILSNDQNLINVFKNNEDIHNRTGEYIFPGRKIGKDERRIAKAVNFGVIYGISPFGLSKMIGKGQHESKEYIERFFASYPLVKEFQNRVIKMAEKNGYVETYFGRRRYINGINDRNSMVKAGAEREAINMPIQGTNADVIKIAMIRIEKFIKEKELNSILIMQVHDELVFDVYEGEEEIITKEAKTIMEQILEGTPLKLKVDAGIGDSWRDAK